MQQSSFFLVLTCEKDAFSGRLSCMYHRMQRLTGYWEVALVDFSKTESPIYMMCDLVDYSYINDSKVQLLDYVTPSNTFHHPNYIKLMHKRFSSINIDIKNSINSDTIPQFKEDITCKLHFRRSAFL
jgi:hypothetical protein